MKNQLIYFYFFISFYSFSQDFEKLGVNFIITDTLITFHNVDKKFKTIKIVEKNLNGLFHLEYSANYEIEGDITQEQKIFSKQSEINVEITANKLKRKFVFRKLVNTKANMKIKNDEF